MITDCLHKEKLFFPIDNDCLDVDSLNQIFSHLYQKEYIKEEIINIPYTFNNNSKLISNNSINNCKDENLSKSFFTKKENINEEEVDSNLLYFVNNKKCDEKFKNVLFFEDSSQLPKKNKKTNKKCLNKIINKHSDISLFKNEIINEVKEKEKTQINNLKLSNKCDKFSKTIKYKRGPYKKRKLFSDKINFEDKCFPFKLGKGVINITTKFNYDLSETGIHDNNNISSCELTDEKTHEDLNSNVNNIKNDLYLMRFITKKYYYSENGRRKKVKKKRKYKADIIRKKIKSRFHKSLKNIINNNLKKAGSKMLFECLPQSFIGNISILLNSKCLELTYKELILTDFASELINYRHTPKDNEKYMKNLKVLKYLEQNPEISQKSGFNIIKNLKYKDILNNYFISAEFEQSLNKLKIENETQEYIQSYIYRAKNYVKFYSNCHDNFQIQPIMKKAIMI